MPARKTDNSLIKAETVQPNIFLSEADKVELVQAKVNQKGLIFESSEIIEIAANISSEFKDRASLNRQILNAIKKYVLWQTEQEKVEISETVNTLIDARNRLDQTALTSFSEISSKLQQNNKEWEKAKDEILEAFKIPE